MSLHLYNSLTRKKEEFIPINPPFVDLYTCGPTVYNYAHIGNLRTYIFNDILQRVLIYKGYKVKRVMNVTDVGHLFGDGDMGMDKVEKAAKERNMDAWELSNFFLEAFKTDMKRLNMLEPTVWEKATDTVSEQIELIQILEKKGYTYKTPDGLYFDTSKFKEYGKISSLDKEGMREAARVDFNSERKNPTDFALWKFNKTEHKRQMEWQSPWGIGFPGWHIECSAIALKHFKNPFDIHTGAIDHKEIHHPNEIVQTECATGKKMANYWLHAGFLNTENADKMSKSKGNFTTLQTLIDKGYDPLVFRYYTFGIHWRQTSNLSWEALAAAQKAYERLKGFIQNASLDEVKLKTNPTLLESYEERFFLAINDDLNMPKALAIVWELIKDEKISYDNKTVLLIKWDGVLGLNLNDKIKTSNNKSSSRTEIPKEIKELMEKREMLRKEKKFSEADAVRLEIEGRGYTLVDKSLNL
ncbi:MAG: cysteine--tRNA ligase [bacterium]